MTKPARYAITTGLTGCYMPDNGPYLVIAHTRKALRDCVAEEIEAQGWPKSCLSQVKLTRLWQHIQRQGSSVAHFSVAHKGFEVAFHGLTKAEYAEAEEAQDW